MIKVVENECWGAAAASDGTLSSLRSAKAAMVSARSGIRRPAEHQESPALYLNRACEREEGREDGGRKAGRRT